MNASGSLLAGLSVFLHLGAESAETWQLCMDIEQKVKIILDNPAICSSFRHKRTA